LQFGKLNKCLTLSDISTGIGINTTYILDLNLTQSLAVQTNRAFGSGNYEHNFIKVGYAVNNFI